MLAPETSAAWTLKHRALNILKTTKKAGHLGRPFNRVTVYHTRNLSCARPGKIHPIFPALVKLVLITDLCFWVIFDILVKKMIFTKITHFWQKHIFHQNVKNHPKHKFRTKKSFTRPGKLRGILPGRTHLYSPVNNNLLNVTPKCPALVVISPSVVLCWCVIIYYILLGSVG